MAVLLTTIPHSCQTSFKSCSGPQNSDVAGVVPDINGLVGCGHLLKLQLLDALCIRCWYSKTTQLAI